MTKYGYRHNCKKAILFLSGIFLSNALFAQEQLILVAEEDTVAFRSGNELPIQAGDIMISDAGVSYWQVGRYAGFHLRIRILKNNELYFAYAKHFRPQNTEDMFGEDIFIDYPMALPVPNFINTWGDPPAAIADAMWVPHYYADILRGQDRNMLFEIYPHLDIGRDDEGNPWYMNSVVNLRHGRAMFYNSAIMLGDGTRLAVRNIRRTNFGYRVDGIVSTSDWRDFWGALLFRSAFWAAYGRGDAVTLLLFLDGDYLDIYTYGTDIHVGTFIRVGREFQIQYQSLIRHNTSDLTNVAWPQRAGVIRRPVPPVVEIAVPAEIEEEPVAVVAEYVVVTADNTQINPPRTLELQRGRELPLTRRRNPFDHDERWIQ